MTPTGFELLQKTTKKSQVENRVTQNVTYSGADLDELLASWDSLDDNVKAAITAMLKVNGKR